MQNLGMIEKNRYPQKNPVTPCLLVSYTPLSSVLIT